MKALSGETVLPSGFITISCREPLESRRGESQRIHVFESDRNAFVPGSDRKR